MVRSVNTAQASLEARLSDEGHERQELLAQLAARDHWFVFICENRMVQFFLLFSSFSLHRQRCRAIPPDASKARGRHSGTALDANGIRSAHVYDFSPTGLLGVGLGGDSTPRMIAFQARLEF